MVRHLKGLFCSMINAKSTSTDMNKRTRVLILGNGFDLDFGFQTTYHRFCEPFFKSKLKICTESYLYNFLKKKYDENPNKQWYDLEQEIREYVTRVQNKEEDFSEVEDRQFMAFLRRNLGITLDIFAFITPAKETEEYAKTNLSEDSMQINPTQISLNKNCVAYKICKEFIDNPSSIDKILSFNYTSFRNLIQRVAAESVNYDKEALNMKMIELDLENKFTPVHISRCGCLLPNENLGEYSILSDSLFGICGIDDSIKLPKNMKFFRKSGQFDDIPVREDIINYINNADNLIIFGHSLGLCDSDYFKDLFCKLFSEDSEDKRITIITYDNKSPILEKIASLTGKTKNELLSSKHFHKLHFLYTKHIDNVLEYDDVLKSFNH